MSYKGITKEELETMRKNGLSFAEEQQLYWKKEDYLEVDKDKEIERLHSIIKEVREEIIKDRKKNYGDLEKKAFYCNKTDKLLEILGSDKE